MRHYSMARFPLTLPSITLFYLFSSLSLPLSLSLSLSHIQSFLSLSFGSTKYHELKLQMKYFEFVRLISSLSLAISKQWTASTLCYWKHEQNIMHFARYVFANAHINLNWKRNDYCFCAYTKCNFEWMSWIEQRLSAIILRNHRYDYFAWKWRLLCLVFMAISME